MWITLLVFLALLGGLLLVFRLSKGSSASDQNTPSEAPESNNTQVKPEPIPEIPVPIEPLPLSPTQLPESLRDFKLAEFSDLDETKKQSLQLALNRIGLPSPTAQQLLLVDFHGADAHEKLVKLVAHEPQLTAKIIGRLNSAFYGLTTPISDIEHAITYLGMFTVRSLALQFAMEQSLSRKSDALIVQAREVFHVSAIAAELCLHLSTHLDFAEPSALTTQTILSSLGNLAMLQLLPPKSAVSNRSLNIVERTKVEQGAFGIHSGIASQLLMQRWNLPPALIESVGDIQRLPFTPAVTHPSLAQSHQALCYLCIWMAEGIVQKQIRRQSQINLRDKTCPELFHLQPFLDVLPLNPLPELILSPVVERLLLRLIVS